MKKHQGIHFYISVVNYQNIVESDEQKGKRQPEHAIHALSTFFSAVERYAVSRDYNKVLTIEKITGARLHMYIVGEPELIYPLFFRVSNFAYRFAEEMSTNVGKYRSLPQFSINVGASYGHFYDYTFNHDGLEEETTIGHACNYAAKLQALAEPVHIAVDETVYESLIEDSKDLFVKVSTDKIKKYGHESYYVAKLSDVSCLYKENAESYEKAINEALQTARNTNLGDINFSDARQPLNFGNLNLTTCKDIEGVPFFADIRGFTSQFAEDDSNLEEMAAKTSNILETMYDSVKKNRGVHIQFQGDREFAVFHNYEHYDSCCVDAILTAMRLIDAVKNYSVSIGVGESMGRMFATKIGARGNKDNIVLGAVVNAADKLEDKYASENQLAISEEVYKYIAAKNSVLARQFIKSNGCYITTRGYIEYRRAEVAAMQVKDKQTGNYNGAWSCDS